MSAETAGDFRKFWAGQTISNLGSSLTVFALPLLVFKLTGSPVNLAATTAAYFLPYLLFGLAIGAWVDRVDRKRLMIGVDLGRALVIGSIPGLAAVDLLSVPWIYAATFASATLTIAFDAGEFAALPSLVGRDDLVSANGRIMASYQGAQVAGPLLAGALVGAGASIENVLAVDAGSFVLSALSLAAIGTSFNAEEPRPQTSIRRDVAEGLRYVLAHPVLRNISLMMAVVNFVGSTTYAQLVLFAKERLGASDSRVGLLFSAGSLGIVAFGLAAGRIRRRLGFSTAALGGLMLSGVATAAMAAMTSYWAALPLWALSTGAGLFFNINTQSLRQAIAPSELLGRVVSIASVLAWSAIPLGTLLGGWVIDVTDDVGAVYGAIGALTFLIAFAFRFTALGHAEEHLPASGAEGEPERALA
ncbi:MAG: MFS transporter [Actinomycetota bacterium]|nr:MFS transporter [Actinomycetota bacterium]